MASPALVDWARLHLYLRAPGSNQGDTNRCTIPIRCRPCRKDRSHLAETISPARCPCTRLRPHLALEIFPAMCWPSIFRRDEDHRPRYTFFLTKRRARRIQTPLRSTNVYLPISRKLLRQGTRCARPDNFPYL